MDLFIGKQDRQLSFCRKGGARLLNAIERSSIFDRDRFFRKVLEFFEDPFGGKY